jgi:hypothetical protein
MGHNGIHWNGAGRLGPDLAGTQTLNIEGGAHGAGCQLFIAFAATDAEFVPQIIFHRGQPCNRGLFLGGQGAHIIAKAGDQDAPLTVAQLRDQFGGTQFP